MCYEIIILLRKVEPNATLKQCYNQIKGSKSHPLNLRDKYIDNYNDFFS